MDDSFFDWEQHKLGFCNRDCHYCEQENGDELLYKYYKQAHKICNETIGELCDDKY